MFSLLACGLLAGQLACGDAPDPPTADAGAPTPQSSPVASAAPSDADLVARGRAIYNSNCIACHNPNPADGGAIGPAVAGSSLALLEAKVIHNTYPPGYTPKRDTNAMIPLPHLAKDIPALHAYLASVK